MKVIGNEGSYVKFNRKKEREIEEEFNLVEIPSGVFLMGDRSEAGYKQEKPVHGVFVDRFFIAKYCVTVREYYQFMIDEQEHFEESWCDFINPCFIIKNGDSYMIWEGAENFPMIQVSFVGAIAYCNWCSLRNGLEPVYQIESLEADLTKNGFRLPKEAEWEYACGGPKGYKYSYSNEFNPDLFCYMFYSGKYKNSRAAYKRIGGFGLHDYSPLLVDTLAPNEFGLHHMLGNVNEWCHDRYALYTHEKVYNPSGGKRGTFRVIRGGCFLDDVDKLRKTYRHAIHPQAKCMIDGFRIARNRSGGTIK